MNPHKPSQHLTPSTSELTQSNQFPLSTQTPPTMAASEEVWKTNLFIDSEFKRVQERAMTFKKRTSFEEFSVNSHLKEMIRVLLSTNLELFTAKLPQSDEAFYPVRKLKKIQDIEANSILNEEQKYEITELILNSQQNFSIFLRLASTFKQSKEQLVFMLCKILQFSSKELPSKDTVKMNEEKLKDITESNKLKLIGRIVNHEVVRSLQLLFFNSMNEAPLVLIMMTWLHNILCIRYGIYSEMDFQETM